MSKTDRKLIEKYNQVYEAGEEKFWTFDSKNEQNCILRNVNFEGKTVLEIGCGTGDMARKMAKVADHVYAIDSSLKAIEEATANFFSDNLYFLNTDLVNSTKKIYGLWGIPWESNDWLHYDVIVMIGVLEHMEDPAAALQFIVSNHMQRGSILAFSCPCHLNPRGYIWAALKILFDVPMSLTDKHMISPSWVIDQAKRLGLQVLKIKTVDQSWGYGRRMIEDYEKRLFKACVDFMKSNISSLNPASRAEKLVEYLRQDLRFHKGHGANAVYFLNKN